MVTPNLFDLKIYFYTDYKIELMRRFDQNHLQTALSG